MEAEKSFSIPYTRRGGIISALSLLIYRKDPVIVEIGMQRDNSPNEDGNSTTVFGSFVANYGGTFHSVDVLQSCIELCTSELKKMKISTSSINLHLMDGISFLETFDGEIDLLYLDAWDYHGFEDELRRSERNHFAAIKAAEPHLKEDSLILIDDVLDGKTFVGKGALVIPYLLDRSYEILHNNYQVLMRKIKKSE